MPSWIRSQVGYSIHIVHKVPRLDIALNRTKVSDPSFANDTSRMDEVSTKAFGNIIAANITDVSIIRRLIVISK